MTTNDNAQPIVPGICVTASGQATIDPRLTDVLCDLAIRLEEPTNLPVDVEHVVGAIVLAARHGQLDRDTSLSADDPKLIAVLAVHVKDIFAAYGGQVGRDD